VVDAKPPEEKGRNSEPLKSTENLREKEKERQDGKKKEFHDESDNVIKTQGGKKKKSQKLGKKPNAAGLLSAVVRSSTGWERVTKIIGGKRNKESKLKRETLREFMWYKGEREKKNKKKREKERDALGQMKKASLVRGVERSFRRKKDFFSQPYKKT